MARGCSNLAEYVPRRWLTELGGLGLPRRDRRGGAYRAYVPDPLVGREFLLNGPTAADVTDAEIAIGALDARAAALTNTETLARILLRAESIASSHIEGLSLSPQRLLRVAINQSEGVDVNDETAIEVLANVDAMAVAVQYEGDISVERLLDIHRHLLAPTRAAAHAGRIRSEQNWIGGSGYNPIGASFVPPPPELVPGLLEDLAAFSNDDSLPAVAQAAIAHAQFETIHPFADGNGRIGRALIAMILRKRGLGRRAMPPVSLALATHARSYVSGLTATRFVGSSADPAVVDAMNGWIGFFAAACSRAVADALSFEDRVHRLIEDWRAKLGPIRRHSTALALLQILPEMPIVTVRSAQAAVGKSFAAVNDAIELLTAAGILTQSSDIKRNRSFEARELIHAFTSLERQLASPEGNTRTSKPARAVPARPH
ncbi:MAG: Fic family protein [Candidatus Velthaea sp.]